MTSLDSRRPRTTRWQDSAAWFVAVLGIALGVAGLAQVYRYPEPIVVQSIESLLVIAPALALVYAGYWVATQRRSYEDQWSIATWSLVGSLTAGLLVSGFLLAEWLVGNAVADSSLLLVIGMLSGGVVGLAAAVANQRHTVELGASEETDTADGRGDIDSLSPPARTVASLASDTRAWYTLQAVSLADRPLGVETIAAQIASLEETTEEAVYLDLVQHRLPKLAADGAVEYDATSGVVRPAGADEPVVATIEALARLPDEKQSPVEE
ncbi:DUF7344 domain-containing protein [Natronorubrum texcoconense]|uniref:4TM region of histidine kinase n=1 Tax=Natronorubrum texcoconense TaxID=1095776 RepID=A0A1G8YQM3_9EURY|nr:hypothetical protein [Natronorubrum texcoconense]SDK04385.1 4TM region of histidine kinase [Natronorubrum texcoconense]